MHVKRTSSDWKFESKNTVCKARVCLVVIVQWSEHRQLKPAALGLIPSGQSTGSLSQQPWV